MTVRTYVSAAATVFVALTLALTACTPQAPDAPNPDATCLNASGEQTSLHHCLYGSSETPAHFAGSTTQLCESVREQIIRETLTGKSSGSKEAPSELMMNVGECLSSSK